jgi:hypothetical protein
MLEKLGVNKDYLSPCDACQDLLVNHRKELLDYVISHKNELLLNEVILTDNKRRELNSYKPILKQQKIDPLCQN